MFILKNILTNFCTCQQTTKILEPITSYDIYHKTPHSQTQFWGHFFGALNGPITVSSHLSLFLLPSPPVGLRGTRRWPEPTESHPHQLPSNQEAHQRGRSEGGNSRCDSLLHRSLPPVCLNPSIITTVGDADWWAVPLFSFLITLCPSQITFLNIQLDRHCLKVSKVADSLMSYTEQFMEYDPFVSATEPSNPWVSDDTSFWDLEAR